MQNGIEFFTATCLNWTKVLEKDEYKRIITNSLQFLVEDKRVWVYGFHLWSIFPTTPAAPVVGV